MKLLKFSIFFPNDCAKEVQAKIKSVGINAEHELRTIIAERTGHNGLIVEWDGKISETINIKL